MNETSCIPHSCAGYAKVELSGESISDEVLYRIAHRNGLKLTHIKLRGTASVTDAALAALFSSAPNLLELDLEHVGPNFRGTCLPLLLAACPKLESLRIEGAPGVNWAGLRPLWPPLYPPSSSHSRLQRSNGATAAPQQPAVAVAAPEPATAPLATAAVATAGSAPRAVAAAGASSNSISHGAEVSPSSSSSDKSSIEDYNHPQADSLSQDGAMTDTDATTTTTSSSSSNPISGGSSSDAGEDASDFLTATEAEGFQLLLEQRAHSRSISAANVMAGLSLISSSSSSRGGIGRATSTQQQLMAAAGNGSSIASSISRAGASGGQGSKRVDSQESSTSSGPGCGGSTLASVDMDTSLSACEDAPYVSSRACEDLLGARTAAVAEAEVAAAAGTDVLAIMSPAPYVPSRASEDLLSARTEKVAAAAGIDALANMSPAQLQVGSLPLGSSGAAAAAAAGGGQRDVPKPLGGPLLVEEGRSSVSRRTAAAGPSSSSLECSSSSAAGAAVVSPATAAPAPGAGRFSAAAVHGRLRDPCPPHKNLRRLHVRFSNLLPGRADNGVPGHPLGSGRCSLEDLLLRVPYITDLTVDGPATVLDFAAKAW